MAVSLNNAQKYVEKENIKRLKWIDERLIMCLVILVLSIFYLIKIPVGMVPDEPAHYYRAFEISEGHMVSLIADSNGAGGNYLPEGVYQYASKETVLDYDNRIWTMFPNTSLYCPASYIPQAIGLKIGTLFTKSAYNTFYAARIGGLVACLLICFAAIYIIPRGRKILFTILIFPMSMQEMISISPDGIVLALAGLYVALLMKILFSEGKIKNRDIIFLALISLELSLCKIVYIILILMIFMIPDEKFESKPQKLITRFAIPVICVVANLAWLKIASGYLMEFNEGVNSGEQVKFVLTHIPTYLRTIIRTVGQNYYGMLWIATMIGSSLGWLNVKIPAIAWGLVLAMLVIEMIITRFDAKIKVRYFVLTLLTFIGGFGLIASSLYVQWTPVANQYIEGIQGRYFIPLCAPAIFAISFIINRLIGKKESEQIPNSSRRPSVFGKLRVISEKYGYLLVVCVAIVANILALIAITRFYAQ